MTLYAQKLAYVYDSFARVTQIKHYDVSTGSENVGKQVNYYYDSSPCGNFTSQNAWGRVTAITGPSLNCITLDLTDMYFSYAASGLLAKKRMGVINSYLEAQYTYNNEGQVTSLSYPGTYEPGVGFNFGPTYNYYYDTMGRPNRMTLNGDMRDWVKDVVYGPAGEMTQKKYWYENVSGVDQYYVETQGYNNSLQLTSLDARTAPTSYSSALITQNYSYDLNGNVNQVVDSTASSTVNYTYDNLNRLSTAATASTAWGLSFTYDDFGNRTGQSVTKGSAPTSSLSISTTNNRITTSGYSYDNNGNLTAMPGSTMSYDIENRMTQITGSFGTENYKYGPDNNRIRKTRGTSIEHYYFYGAYGELLGVYAPYTSGGITYGNMTVERNVYFAGKLIRSKQTSSSGTVTDAAVVVDRLGSVRNRSNVNVSVNQGSINYPFGEEIIGTDNNREKFATYFRDKDTGLDYARNRYYASTMGRFTTPDPYGGSAKLGNPQSWNRYVYASNNPTTLHDSAGLLAANVTFGEGFGGCVPLYDVPWGEIDASSDCPPGFVMQDGAFRSSSRSRLQQVFGLFEPLSGFIDIWEYANKQGTRFNLYLPDETAELLVAAGLLDSTDVMQLPVPVPWKLVVYVSWVAIEAIQFWWEARRNNDWLVTCHFHPIGTPDHEASDREQVIVYARDATEALTLGKLVLVSRAQAKYGPTGFHLQHCDVIKK